MKVVLIGEGASVPSGFGQQMGHLARALVKKNHEVHMISSTTKPSNIPRVEEWRLVDLHQLGTLDRLLAKLTPDAVIFFWHSSALLSFMWLRHAPANCPVFYWFPYEAGSIGNSPFYQDGLELPHNRVVYVSEHTRKMWGGRFTSDYVIPHAVDREIFHPYEGTKLDLRKLRKKWGERARVGLYPDDLIILNVDRNITHKRWDLSFDYLKRLLPYFQGSVKMLVHSSVERPKGPNHPGGYDMRALEKVYGVEGKVGYTGFDWESPVTPAELAELYWTADVRISTSSGEGFGIPTLEAAACKRLQILPHLPAFESIIGPTSRMMVPCAGTELRNGEVWSVPDVRKMADLTAELVQRPSTAQDEIDKAYEYASKSFTLEGLGDQWDFILRSEAKSAQRCFIEHRWGYFNQTKMVGNMRDAAIVTSKLMKNPTVMDVGSASGKFLDWCLDLGLDAKGVEFDAHAVMESSQRSRSFTMLWDMEKRLPQANIFVLTDTISYISGTHGVEGLQRVLANILQGDWLLIHNGECVRWNLPDVTFSGWEQTLEEKGFSRRRDLENTARTSFAKAFVHQIWERGSAGTIPPGFLEFIK